MARACASATRNPRSADVFDAEHNPRIMFESTRSECVDDDTPAIAGRLTVHGTTGEIVPRAELTGAELGPRGNGRVALEVTGQLSRGDHGMRLDQALDSGNMLASDRVTPAPDIPAIRQAS